MNKKNANGKRAVKDLTAKRTASVKGGEPHDTWSNAQNVKL